MKWLFLALATFIGLESAKAYARVGMELSGGMGRIIALIIFVMVQSFELRPIVLMGGHGGVLPMLSMASAGKPINMNLADPEELADAASWATRAYLVDFVCGLFVWTPLVVSSGMIWSVIRAGAVTFGDLSFRNCLMIVSCVFALQWCVAQYLRRGGKLPGLAKGKAHAN